MDGSFQVTPKMKPMISRLVAIALAVSAVAFAQAKDGWLTSYQEAVKQSQKTGKPIMADFTGSDWCGWCIRLHHEVFDTPEFKKWAAKNVVLLELDYPHKVPQSKEIKRQNEGMLKKFPYIEGFPTVLFLKPDGKAFGKYGYDMGGPAHWTAMAEKLIKPKSANVRPLRFAAKSDGYPAPVVKNLYANNDFRGKTAPKLIVEKWLSGNAPDTKGKVVLIDFWATWCPPCRGLIPELNAWQKKYGDDLVIIGISDEKPEVIQNFMKKTKMAYNVAVDTKETTMKTVDVTGVPHVLVITPDHIVRWQGFPDGDEEKLTDKILQQIIETSRKQNGSHRR